MKNIIRSFKNFLKVIFILAIINICLSLQNNYAMATTNNKIKVGYSNISEFIQVKDGVFSGFLFEYLREIAKYTGWEYEFIEMNIDYAINKLRNGEIDLVGGIPKNEKTMELYDFPKYNSGITYTTLVTLKNNNSIDISNSETLNGIKVGYFEKSKFNLESFDNFCKTNGIENIELVPYSYENNKNILKEALNNKEVDAIISRDVLLHNEEKIIAKFGERPYYFATTKGNYDIISDLNDAISKIKEKKPDYEQVLYNKYFKTFHNLALNLNKEEEEYINNVGVLKGIYIDNNIPVQYFNNKTNKAEGIYIDLVSLIMKRAGIEFELIKTKNYEEAYNMIENKEADFILALPDSYLVEKEQDIFLTESYMDIDLVKVKNKKITEDDEYIVALVEGYRYNKLNNNNNEVKFYENLKECLKAIDRGEATETSFNNYSIISHITMDYYSNLAVVHQQQKTYVSMGFAKPIDKKLISIVNKSINTLSIDEIDNIIYANTSAIQYRITLKQLIIENTELFILLIIVSFIIIIYRIRKLKESKELLLKKSQTDVLTGMYNREIGEILVEEYLRIKPLNLYSAFAIIDIDYFKQVNDKLGHQIGDIVLKEFALILKDIFADEDIICRLGGDEFVVFMKDIEEDNINLIEKKLDILCKTMNKDIEDNNIKQEISLSIGCVVINRFTNFKGLYKEADKMLYYVKNNGKNGFKIKNYNID